MARAVSGTYSTPMEAARSSADHWFKTGTGCHPTLGGLLRHIAAKARASSSIPSRFPRRSQRAGPKGKQLGIASPVLRGRRRSPGALTSCDPNSRGSPARKLNPPLRDFGLTDWRYVDYRPQQLSSFSRRRETVEVDASACRSRARMGTRAHGAPPRLPAPVSGVDAGSSERDDSHCPEPRLASVDLSERP